MMNVIKSMIGEIRAQDAVSMIDHALDDFSRSCIQDIGSEEEKPGDPVIVAASILGVAVLWGALLIVNSLDRMPVGCHHE